MKAAKILFLSLIIALITSAAGLAGNDTEAVNRFYGVVLKEDDLRKSLKNHQALRKSAFIKEAETYEAFLRSNFDASADSGDLGIAKDCQEELGLVGEFITSIQESSNDAVSDSLEAPNLTGLSAKPPSEVITFRQTWDKGRHQVLADLQKKLRADLDTFVAELTKQRKFDDAQAVSDFQQLVANQLTASQSVLAAIANRENPKTRFDHIKEDEYLVTYCPDMYSYHHGVLVDPSKYFWIDRNQGRGTLYLRFNKDQLGASLNRINKVLLTLNVPTFGDAHTSNHIRVDFEGKLVGIKKGAKKGERIQLTLNWDEIEGHDEFILRVTCSGSNGMGIIATGPERPRLLLDFE